jgi:DNA-binding LytR/AlgR family response regulator
MVQILIADDEKPARGELRYILEELWPGIQLVEAVDGLEVLELIEQEPIDIAFLDINMPELDGLEIAAALLELPNSPAIVFATAYDEHALEAFELAAVDYVVKPFDERRLAQTVARLKEMVADQKEQQINEATLRDFVSRIALSASFTKLWGERENETRRLVDYADILWLEARDKKIFMGTEEEELLVRHTLKELESQLPETIFVRVHRGYIVNLEHIAEVVPWFSGTYIIRMDDSEHTEIPMSRRYAATLKQLTGW